MSAVVFKRPSFLSATVLRTLWRHLMHSPQEGAEILLEKLGMMQGPMVKLAQLTAMVPDLLPEHYRKRLLALCNQSTAMPWGVVRRCMAGALGSDWSRHFESFHPTARFAASLGQVHEAYVHGGKKVACKIQYPDIGFAMESDLRHVGWMLRFYEKWSGAVRTQKIFQELCTRMRQEIDYQQEAQNIHMAHMFFNGHPFVCVPDVEQYLSTKTVLTLSWLEGQPMDMAHFQPQWVRNRIAVQLLHGWYVPFFSSGWIHGDPHQGNVTWHDEGINILDWGCVRHFDRSFVQSIGPLYQGILHNNPQQRHAVYDQWGVAPLNAAICEGLDLWTGFLMAPFVQEKPCSFSEISSPLQGKAIAKQAMTLFRQGGGIIFPPDFLIFDRVAVVLGSMIMSLNARVSWANVWQEINKEQERKK